MRSRQRAIKKALFHSFGDVKKAFFFFGFLCSFLPVKAQVNYVQNPSLEKYDSCPNSIDNINDALYWSAIDSNLIYAYAPSLTDGIPEYCNICSINSNVNAPNNAKFYHYPRTGNGMSQVMMFNDETVYNTYLRDYLQGRLYKHLIANKSYCVTFYVSLEQASQYAINHIGAYLDNGILDTTHYPGHVQTEYSPQIVENAIINDTLNWIKVEGSFVADGTEKFITIGSFFDTTNTAHVPTGAYEEGLTWYIVDDVSVIESDTKAFAWGTDTLHKGYLDSILIGRDEIIPGIQWYRDGVLIDTLNAGIWIKDDTLGTYHTYILAQTLCGVTTYDTVVVSVDSISSEVNNVKLNKNSIIVYPNPSNGSFAISGTLENSKDAAIEIFNILGQTIYSETVFLQNNKLEQQLNLQLSPGVYVLHLRGTDGVSYTRNLIFY